MPRVSIIGTGYVGLCTGLMLAENGHNVTLVDIDPQKVKNVQSGTAPFHEPGLDDALKTQRSTGRLTATTDTQTAIQNTTHTFLCVGTPQDEDGAADLTAIEKAARDVGKALQGIEREHTLITKSTVPPGTTRTLIQPAARNAANDAEGDHLHIAMNPEFLREGSAIEDARNPDKIVIGSDDPETIPRVEILYQNHDAPIVRTDASTAEMIKYANNAFLATKITFANEMANLAETVGADWEDIAQAIGLDHRINPNFFRAGVGFGGSCFPKDVQAIAHLAREHERRSRLLDAVLEANHAQPIRAVDLLEEETGPLEGKRIALLGLSFKPDTDDVRNTRAAPIYDELTQRGAKVTAHDPQAAKNFQDLRPDARIVDTVDEALQGAHGVIVQAAWTAYTKLEPTFFTTHMEDAIVVDGRRALDAEALKQAGITYRAIGQGRRLDA